MMNKETYERLYMDVTLFDAEDVITTSDVAFDPEEFELTGQGATATSLTFPGA